MPRVKQIRDPEFSLWQSAVDQIVAKRKSGPALDVGHKAAVQRPDTSDPMVAATSAAADQLAGGVSLAHAAVAQGGPKATEGVADVAKYCASIWWQIAKARVTGNMEAEKTWKARLGPFTTCDARWAEVVEQYVSFFRVKGGAIPYRVWKSPSDFILDWKIPAKARIAIFGDWGTGQPEAKALLGAISRKNCDAVIHLGDIYYSGTEFEMENYFLTIWKQAFDLAKTRTFTLAGNHDYYAGGAPFYRLIDTLGQPSSYFTLRNDDWQIVSLDTGLHDTDVLDATPTFLEDTEVQWLKDKIDTAGTRKTLLLSHHQLFTAFEDIGGRFLNDRLNQQVSPFLAKVAAWFWGHEHNQVVYKPFQGVLARCIGHAAYPVGISEIPAQPKFPQVPLENVQLGKGPSFYAHGYIVLELDGPKAKVSYYQDTDPEDTAMFTETL